MAFMYDIRNLKDCMDYKNKREEFFRLLRLQQKLNRNAEQAILARQQLDLLGVVPIPPTKRSVEEDQQDLMLQQQLAMRNLKSIMSEAETMKLIHMLDDPDVYFLNTEFGRLVVYLQGRTNITADFMRRVIQRYKTYLDVTGMTGVPIPLTTKTIEGLPGDLREEWENYARQIVDPLTNRVKNLEDLIQQTAEAMKRSVEDVKMEVDDVHEESKTHGHMPPAEQPVPVRGAKRKGVTKMNLLTKKPKTMLERLAKRSIEEVKAEEDLMPSLKRSKITGEPILPRQVDQGMQTDIPTRGSKRSQPDFPTPTVPDEKKMRQSAAEVGMIRGKKRGQPDFVSPFDEDTGKRANTQVFERVSPAPTTASAEVRGVKRKVKQQVEMAAKKKAQVGALTVDAARRLAREEIEGRMSRYNPPVTNMPGKSTRPLTASAQSMLRIRGRPRIVPASGDFEPEYTGMPYNEALAVTNQMARMARTGHLTVHEARQLARQEIDARAENRAQQVLSGQAITSGMGSKVMPSRLVKRNGKILGKMGRGIASNNEVKEYSRYRAFGKYMIHVPSLKKCMINVKYPSLIAVHHIPQKYVSKEFIDMVDELMNTNIFNKSKFNRLEEDEQTYFRFLADKCDFDLAIGMGMTETVSQREKEEYDRFEVLRGSVIAGNNSPEVLKELQQYIIKFINQKRLPKQQGHDLLYEMACLQVS